jgi:hypothetical protein
MSHISADARELALGTLGIVGTVAALVVISLAIFSIGTLILGGRK